MSAERDRGNSVLNGVAVHGGGGLYRITKKISRMGIATLSDRDGRLNVRVYIYIVCGCL